MAAASDSVTYALDDHHLAIYIPWTFFVFCLWLFVAAHVDLFRGHFWQAALGRSLVFAAQALITVELTYFATEILNRSPETYPQRTPSVVIICFWAWVLVAALGWANLIRSVRHRSEARSALDSNEG